MAEQPDESAEPVGSHELLLHELKTPLTAILMNAHVLLNDGHRPERRRGHRALERIAWSARAMQSFVTNMLDASAADRGALRVSCRQLPLLPIIDEALEVTSPIARSRRIRVERSSCEPLTAWCERSRVLQVLLNLLTNALKFSPPGSTVSLRVASVDEGVRVSVSDQGPGLTPGLLERLFEPCPSDPAMAGHGLGLYISQRLARALGGALSAETRLGHGTVFHLTLPRGEAASARDAMA